MLKLEWSKVAEVKTHKVTIQIDVYDRPGLLNEITELIGQEQINISFIHTPPTAQPGEQRVIITLVLQQPRQLVRILHQVAELVNVHTVRCIPRAPQ